MQEAIFITNILSLSGCGTKRQIIPESIELWKCCSLKIYILTIPTVDCASSRHVDVVTLILYSLNLTFLIILAYCFQPRRLPVIESRLFPRLIRYCAVDGCLCALLWRLYEVYHDVVKQPLRAREKGVVGIARCLGSHESRVHCISGHSQA